MAPSPTSVTGWPARSGAPITAPSHEVSKYQSRLDRAGIAPDLSEAEPIALALWELVGQARAAEVDAETALRELCRRVAEAAASPGRLQAGG